MPLPAQLELDSDPFSALKALLNEDLKGVDQLINRQLHSSVPLIPILGRHLIDAGGKRLRPLLTLASYRLFQKKGHDVYGLAAAVEFIHTATLLHDDVIDESKLRRGLPTANELWGNPASVLVGDFLFARAFQLMILTQNPDVLKILADAAACISEGEVLQLSLCHVLDVDSDDCLKVIEAKTATLFAAACQAGALMASSTEYASSLQAYGLNLGMAFQIVDDILDYCATEKQLGKDIGNDFREGKITLPVILSYPNCTVEEKQFFKRTLIDHQQEPDDLSRILTILNAHNGFKKAYTLAESYGKKAHQALQDIPNHPIKSLLIDLIQFTLIRSR